MKNVVILGLVLGLLTICGCAASTHTSRMKFEPVNPEAGHTQDQDEAHCRIEFDKYRAGINSNWFSGDFYRDCMISKGYREVK